MGNAPKHYCDQRDDTDEPLHSAELVFHRPYRHNRRPFAGLERNQKEYPDEQDGDDADGERDKKPDTPTRLRSHVLESDDVLRGCNGRSSTPNIGREGNTKDEGFGEVGVRWQITKKRLMCC